MLSARQRMLTQLIGLLQDVSLMWFARVLIIVTLFEVFVTQTREPSNITRTENETNVFIPCPFEFRRAPSIWRINGTDYFGATLPPIYEQTAGGIFINRVDRCLNHTSFQCIDTSDDSLQGQESDVGFLTVISLRKCEKEIFFQALSPEHIIELDHQRIVYGSINTTLAWINTAQNSCDISQILSHLPCRSSNKAALDITTKETEVTVLSENFQITGCLADFNISTSSDQPSAREECPALLEPIRVNVTQTEILNLLVGVGKKNCTCVHFDCQGSLYVAISKPDTIPPDVICPIYIDNTRSCYNLDGCKLFSGTPFFRICESQLANTGCTYSMCFGNITEELNGTRLDFFILNRTICDSGEPSYLARVYIKSFKLNVRNASANISVDTMTGVICFYSSPQECNLTRLTHYNISIADSTGNIVFMNETIPESSCMNIQEVLHTQCFPYLMSTQPLNNFITYNSVDQLITDDTGNTGDVCSCINETVNFEVLNVAALHENSLISISYLCSTEYFTQLNITVIMSTGKRALQQQEIVCSAGGFSFNNSGLNQCDQVVDLKGYWTPTDINGTMSNCWLFNNPISIPCPTMSPTPNSGTITAVVVVTLLIVILILILAVIVAFLVFKKRETIKVIWKNWRMKSLQHGVNRDDITENIQDKGNVYSTSDSKYARDIDESITETDGTNHS